MALICDVELESGLTINDAYLRLSNFRGTEEMLHFDIYVYVDKNNFLEGKTEVSRLSFSVDFDPTRNLLNQVYEHVRSLPEYEDAVSA